jgi:anthranilate synthase/aminodeoxychorismate synthase-like glutamine amidotransferase
MTTLIIDNYDSFSYNLYQRIGSVDTPPWVVRNDEIGVEGVRKLSPTRIVLSPGPGNPCDPSYFGVCADIIRELGPRIPTLGVCLGHQGIGHVFGGRVVRAREVMHGKTSVVFHSGLEPLFAGIPRAFTAMRYHSLVIEPASLPDCLEVTAKTSDDVIMAVRHRVHPIYGVQFHPESIGTEWGIRLLANFLGVGAKIAVDSAPRGHQSAAALAAVG